MSRRISNVADIRREPRKPWTVLIQVLENGHEQLSSNKEKNRFKRIVMTDSQGTKLTALIFNSNLRYFEKLLTQYKRYYISNAGVIDNDQRYRLSSYPYSWVLNNRTLVEELVDAIPMTLPCEFEFTKFSNLHKYADTESFHNVRAIVLQCFPSKEQGSAASTRDVVIVNEEKKLLLLTLWNKFDETEGATLGQMIEERPMIFGMRLKVTTFNSLSLTTRTSSGIMINPPIIDGLQMQDWYNNNKQEIKKLLELKSYNNTDMLLPYPKDDDIISVATAIASLNTLKTCWIKGSTSFPRQERSAWYTACANCQKALEADLSWVVTCPSCRVESEVQALSRLAIRIDDGTASITATICTPDAEKLMPFTAAELREAEEISLHLHDDIAMSVKQHTIVAFIRSYETTYRGQTELKINVVKAYKLGEVPPQPNLLELPSEKQVYESDVASPVSTILPPKEHISGPVNNVLSEVVKEKEQLFSPSTKLALEEISSTIASKNVKRSLPFTSEQIDKVTVSTTSKAQPSTKELPTRVSDGNAITFVAIKKEIGAQITDGSPIKKLKEL